MMNFLTGFSIGLGVAFVICIEIKRRRLVGEHNHE
jgi:hypothetical protein